MPPVDSPLARLLDVLVNQYGGTASTFAKVAHVTPSQLSNWRNPRSREKPPNVAACLRIAFAGHCSFARVLHAANHHAYAKMIEATVTHDAPDRPRAFGEPRITAHELAHLVDWRKLSPQHKRMATTITKALLDGAPEQRVKRPPAQKERA